VAQLAVPVSDLIAGAWVPSTGSTLFGVLDESVADDGDYASVGSNSTMQIGLDVLRYPVAGTRTLSYRISGSPAKRIIARLVEGSTTLETWTDDPAPSTLTTVARAVSATISDYSNLRLELETADATSPPTTAVTWGAIGTAANGTLSATPAYPSGISAATSHLFCVVTGRSNIANTAPTMPAGWTSVGSLEGGTGTWGVDAGTRREHWFKKDTVTGTETGTVTVSLAGSTANTMRATILRIEVPAGYSLDVAHSAGADTTSGTAYSVTGSTALSWAANDLLLIATAQSIDSATQSAQAISASGVTFGTRTNRWSTAVTSGNDHRSILDSVPITSGSGSSAPTYSYTASAAASGVTGFLRLRAVPPTEFGRVSWVQFEIPDPSGGTSTLSIDGLVQSSGLTSSVSVDAALSTEGSASGSMDALIVHPAANWDVLWDVSWGTDVLFANVSTQIDGIVKKLGYTTQVNLDSLIAKVNAATLGVDSILRAAAPLKQLLMDAVLVRLLDEAVPMFGATSYGMSALGLSDANVIPSYHNLSIDAILGVLETLSATQLDAILRSTSSASSSLDAILESASTSAGLSLDAYLIREGFLESPLMGGIAFGMLPYGMSDEGFFGTREVSLDVIIKKTGVTSSVSADSYLQKVITAGISTDALLRGYKEGYISLNALLQTAFTKIVSLDANLKSVTTRNITLDALLQTAGAQLAQTILDAIIAGDSVTQSTSIDAILRDTKNYNTDLDAILYFIGSNNVSVDAIIKGTVESLVSLDSLIQIAQASEASFDAFLQGVSSVSTSIEAWLQSEITSAVYVDGLLQTDKSVMASVDGHLQKTQTPSAEIDALLQLAQTGVISLNAILVALGATEALVELDALLQIVDGITSDTSIDSMLQEEMTISTELDAYLLGNYQDDVSIDSYLQSTAISQFTADAYLQIATATTGLLDAYLVTGSTTNANFDALISKLITTLVSLDSVLLKRQGVSISLDALFTSYGVTTVSIDSILTANANTKQVSIDGLLKTSFAHVVNLDSLFQTSGTSSLDTDAILVYLGLAVSNLDAYLFALSKTTSTRLDAVVGQILADIDFSFFVQSVVDRYSNLTLSPVDRWRNLSLTIK
jgi:hypothetical protein